MECPTLHVIGDKLYVVGGGNDIYDVDVYDKNDAKWSVVKDGLKTSRSFHGAAVVDANFFPECDN